MQCKNGHVVGPTDTGLDLVISFTDGTRTCTSPQLIASYQLQSCDVCRHVLPYLLHVLFNLSMIHQRGAWAQHTYAFGVIRSLQQPPCHDASAGSKRPGGHRFESPARGLPAVSTVRTAVPV
jgi:hypothetical protein